jgi:ATP-dependent Lhr-like helicase
MAAVKTLAMPGVALYKRIIGAIMTTLPETFHPTIRAWFDETFRAPTPVQTAAWQAIAADEHTLIAAPTGSGKTLAAFLASIDHLLKQGLNNQLQDETTVLYVSPLKALSNDIHRNLQQPLNGIRDRLLQHGIDDVTINVNVRTGDTSQSERSKMRRTHPHILVTTPESLFILLTSESGRDMLANVQHVIVDEIHALAGNKRGAHLALSLQRLDRLTRARHRRVPVRIGISATQKPIENMAHYLVGSEQIPVKIIDTGHVRDRDLQIVLPDSPMEAVMANEVWDEIYNRLYRLIDTHSTTLIFVNTRRMAERVAHHLAERLGDEHVTAHHGSLSRKHRFRAEQQLKSGQLSAVVATASLELGIDVGDIDLVCQLGSPRGIATFLQRVGRSGHAVDKTPKGRIFPLSHNDLLECTALLHSIMHAQLDKIDIPAAPLDVLSQQVVAEVAAGECSGSELYQTLTGAWPYRGLSRQEFDDVIRMLNEGYSTSRGRRGAYLHRDIVNDRLRAKRGARLTAVTNGGAIPDQFDYDVILQPAGTFVGNLNEDFAFESMPGDIFQLGNTSYRMLKIEAGKVFVEDAHGQPPNIPFWFGEAPGRSDELSEAVSQLVDSTCEQLKQGLNPAKQFLQTEYHLTAVAADELANYLASAQAALGVLPDHDNIVMERFFDEVGDMHLVIHSPYGSRINRAWGLALRKRFCRQFNFELQAAATDNTIVLSLGPTHSFPLEEVARYLNSKTVRQVLIQALLDAPMFATHWRWNCNISLAVPRNRNGKRVPAQFQRSNAEDLIAVVFPDQLACLENIRGDREIPDHPLVKQTLYDCLHEVMDVDGLERVYRRIENNDIKIHCRDLAGPSPLCGEILTARPYAFLDDAPAEERRTQNITQRRYTDPYQANELASLNPAAIARVREEAWPVWRDADELYDALMQVGFLYDAEAQPGDRNLLKKLADEQRVTYVLLHQQGHWVCAERLHEHRQLYPDASLQPAIPVIPIDIECNRDIALNQLLKSRLECSGPVTVEQLSHAFALPSTEIEQGLLALQAEGFAIQGTFENHQLQWCERGLLARIHRYTIQTLRKQIEPVSPQAFMRFLFAWQHVSEKVEGADALVPLIEQLEGFALPAFAWEKEILPARMQMYLPQYLDQLCNTGRLTWRRLLERKPETTRKAQRRSLLRNSAICLLPRAHQVYWPVVIDQTALTSQATKLMQVLQERGACFYDELQEATQLLDSQLEAALAELAVNGVITTDSFTGVRALIAPAQKSARRRYAQRINNQLLHNAGRWSLVMNRSTGNDEKRTAHVARVLLKRYGVIFRALLERESNLPSWRELHYELRRMEARGEIRGGRFINGFAGEQFALPEAITPLRNMREAKLDHFVIINACDPLNLAGIITPGTKVPVRHTLHVMYRNGLPVARIDKGKLTLLTELSEQEVWEAQNRLLQHINPARYQKTAPGRLPQ